MIELLQDVLPWFAAFYLFDALLQVRRGERALAANLFGRIRTFGEGLHLGGLSPAMELLRVCDLPLVPGVRGIHLRSGPAAYDPAVLGPSDFEAMPWPEPDSIKTDRHNVILGPGVVVRTPSPSHARSLAETLRAIAAEPPERRKSTIAGLVAQRSDVAALVASRRRTAPLRIAVAMASAIAFAGWFLAAPVVAFGGEELAAFAMPVVIALLATHALVLGLGAAFLLKDCAGSRTVGLLAPIAIFPPAGAHALAHLTRGRDPGYDAAALAFALLRDAGLESFARRHRARSRIEGDAFRNTDAEAFFAARERAAVRMMEAVGLGADELPLPAMASSDAAGFCPVCEKQYRASFDRCTDCGIAVESFRAAVDAALA